MKNLYLYVLKYCAYLLLSVGLFFLSIYLKNDFFIKFLDNNIITFLVTLLAINIAVCGLVLGKLHELYKKNLEFFNNVISQMKISFIEQLVLILIAIVNIICHTSEELKNTFLKESGILDVILLFTFIYGLDILRDTGNSIFILFKNNGD